MMESFIDEKYMMHFFESLITTPSFSDEDNIRREILKYFKSKTDMVLDSNFSKILDQLEPEYKSVLSRIITDLTTGRNGTDYYSNQQNKFRNLKNVNIYSKIKKPFVSFWLGNKYKHPIDKYRNANPYYFLTDNDDIENWESFSKDKTFHVSPEANKNSEDVFNSWEQIKNYSHPYKDILISDHFCFTNKDRIRKNIIPLISGISSNKSIIENILIFTEKGKLMNDSLEQTHTLIKDSLNEYGINSNILIFQIDKRNDFFKLPHDRYILTNNIFIKSGDSFDFFRENDKYKTTGTSFSIFAIHNANKSDLNDLINKSKHIYNNADSDMFYGEKSKNMLDF